MEGEDNEEIQVEEKERRIKGTAFLAYRNSSLLPVTESLFKNTRTL